jgi:acetate---CoA ligase (ADP-forming) subunit beta
MASPGRTLSEWDSKRLLAGYGVPVVEEALAPSAAAAVESARKLGFPVAVKLCGASIAHKTERDLVRLALGDAAAVAAASTDLLARRRPGEEDAALLVQRMIKGRRELIAGLVRDRQFGPCVMLGLGGVLAEALEDVVFRVAPLERVDALEMIDDLRTARVLGAFRGEPPVDREPLVDVLCGLARLGLEREDVRSVDLNPLIVAGSRVVAVDALVELEEGR